MFIYLNLYKIDSGKKFKCNVGAQVEWEIILIIWINEEETQT